MSDELFDGIGDEYSDRFLAFLIRDRREMGNLDEDQITDEDVWLCDFLGLVSRFKQGEQLSQKERTILANCLVQSATSIWTFLEQKQHRREASKRGGLAGRSVDQDQVMRVWKRNYAAIGKKREADIQTEQDPDIHAHRDTIKKIRLRAARK